MKFDYNSPEVKILRVVAVLVGAAIAIGWLVSQYSWASDIMRSPGLSALKLVFVLLAFLGIALLVRTIWRVTFGRGAVDVNFSWSTLLGEALIIAVGFILYYGAQAGWFGVNWVIYPV